MATTASAIMSHEDEEAIRSSIGGPVASLLGGVKDPSTPATGLAAEAASALGGGSVLGGIANAPIGGAEPAAPKEPATATLAEPNLVRQMTSYDPGGMGGFGNSDGSSYRPGMGGQKPGDSPFNPAPLPSVLPKDFGKGSPDMKDNPLSPYYPGNSLNPKPIAPAIPPPAPPTNAAPEVDKAQKKVDEEQQHGFASNILAGGMFQSPPELARNILLGN